MDDREDPISHFFPGQESVDLYAVLSLTSDAKLDDIKKAYRRLALLHHPDKQATATEERKAEAATKFQQVGFAYGVLSDEKRRQRYDKTGQTDEGFDFGAGEDGWDAYFEELFDRVTRGKLDEMKKEYQGSSEEVEDLKSAYLETKGSIGEIMTFIPHSTYDDEARFIVVLSDLIAKGDLPALPTWTESIKDEKSKLVRKKQGEQEAAEAEQMAKELGVWEEFYGSGKPSERKNRGKGKGKQDQEEEEDHSALQALILKKQKKSNDFFDSLAAKYAEPEPKSRKGKKRSNADAEAADESPRKKQRGVPPPPEIDDAEFEKLQQKLFGDKAGSNTKGRKGKKAK
ncbi:DnaJ-domain-containing protein [Mycena sanguinolenta]|uniref:DnaJ-domain-containing protein n=1 Tax=Mycena sanguinolenta TaxID=230812 RepID=A0A8H7D8J4_9AGAR|nr:DnaJ-domain-containing protein [Mycena sanguinolenta]